MDDLERKRWMGLVAMLLWVAQAAYILFPFDLLPDFIPVIGWMDDLVSLIGLGATTVWMVKTVRESGLAQLLGTEPEVIEAEAYEPIPAEVLRSL